MTFDEWIKFGFDQGWCSPPICEMHDGTPMSEDEEVDWDEGEPCIHVVRLYESELHKKRVERNFSPAVWRASNLGWKVR